MCRMTAIPLTAYPVIQSAALLDRREMCSKTAGRTLSTEKLNLKFAPAVPTEPVRTEQPRTFVINGRDRSALLNRPVQIRLNLLGAARPTCTSTRHSFRLR